MRPYDCKTIDQVCALRRDNFDAGDFWIITDGYNVSLAEQKVGEKSTGMVTIPRREFNRLVTWYMREQKVSAK